MPRKHQYLSLITALLAAHLTISTASATPVIYNDEAKFLADINSLGYQTYTENFEGPGWDHVRSTDPFNLISATEVTNLGITWHARSGNLITTNHNWAKGNGWGIFEDQRQGFSSSELFGSADRTLYAVGGWIKTNPSGADVTIEVNGQIVDGVITGVFHTFVGVIDTAGFTDFRVLDIEGQTVWGADDFTYAADRAPQIEFILDPTINVCPAGGETIISWNGATPGGPGAILYSPALGNFIIPNNFSCGGTQLDLSGVGLKIGFQGNSDASGGRQITANIPPSLCGFYLQFVDISTCDFSAPVQIQ